MIEINNKRMCEFCFSPIPPKSKECPCCTFGSNKSSYPTALPEKTILSGRYVVGRVLGKGGFGITYLCYDSKDEKKVAVKEYLPDSLTHRNSGELLVSYYNDEREEYFKIGAKKFYEEAKLLSCFNGNPNIISVSEFFFENNTTYFVMEYLDGIDLRMHIRNSGGKISEGEAVYILKSLSDALMIIHNADVLHRDISPDNIFICRDRNIKLIDFGAARQVLGEASKSLSVILKQGFAPFEQYQRHGKQGPWTDIYALGASIYYSLTGRLIDDAMSRIDDPTLNTDGISPEFIAIIEKMLAVKAADRYQSITELKNSLAALEIKPRTPQISITEAFKAKVVKPLGTVSSQELFASTVDRSFMYRNKKAGILKGKVAMSLLTALVALVLLSASGYGIYSFYSSKKEAPIVVEPKEDLLSSEQTEEYTIQEEAEHPEEPDISQESNQEPEDAIESAYELSDFIGSFLGGGTPIESEDGSIEYIGTWTVNISNTTQNSFLLQFNQNESDYYLNDVMMKRQSDGSYKGHAMSDWGGESRFTIWLENPNRISVTVENDADSLGTETLHRFYGSQDDY